MEGEMNVLVVGIGNILMHDEGLGVRAVERLRAAYVLPPEVEVLDGGTLGMYLLPRLEGVTHLLICDAVQTGGAAGALVRLEGDAIGAVLSPKMSMHQLGLQDLLALASLQGTLTAHVVVWGMEPAVVELGLALSPAVSLQLDALMQALVRELIQWGLAIEKISVPPT
jgi:hydrogenase maturation protease